MRLMLSHVKKTFIALLLIYLLFPATIFFNSLDKLFEYSSNDGKYNVIAYKMKVYNIFSLYKLMINENYYFVVYDKCGHVVFKPSLWFGVGGSIIYGGFHFSKYNKNELFFPTNNGIDSVELTSDSVSCL